MNNFNEPDKDLLEEFILNLLIKTEQKKDRTYLDTIKRILEGNERSTVAKKYKNDSFYGRFPGITRGIIGKTLKILVEESKIDAFNGRNNLLYFTVNPTHLSKIEEKNNEKLAELLANQLI